MEEAIECFKGQYFQLIPAVRFSLSDAELLRDPEFQERLMDEVVLQTRLDVPQAYRMSITKFLLRRFEALNVEVDERLTELYASLICCTSHELEDTTVQETAKVRYWYARDAFLTIHESPSLLAAHGITGIKAPSLPRK